MNDHPVNADDVDWLTTQSRAPEEHTVFRLTQLAILLGEIAPVGARTLDLERLGYYDFFAANPFAIFEDEDGLDRARLHRAAFDERQFEQERIPLNVALEAVLLETGREYHTVGRG